MQKFSNDRFSSLLNFNLTYWRWAYSKVKIDFSSVIRKKEINYKIYRKGIKFKLNFVFSEYIAYMCYITHAWRLTVFTIIVSNCMISISENNNLNTNWIINN